MPLELFVTVTDIDVIGTTAVDEFVIPISDDDSTDSMFGPPTTYSGTCGTGTTLDVSIRVTTDMDPPGMGPSAMSTGGSSSLFLRSVAFTLAVGAIAGVTIFVT